MYTHIILCAREGHIRVLVARGAARTAKMMSEDYRYVANAIRGD